MALSYKARRRIALWVLVVGLPIYIVLASKLATWIAPSQPLVQLAIYVGLGVLWIFPLKPVFKGVGQADPGAGSDDTRD